MRVGADGRWRVTVPDGPGDYDVTVATLPDQQLRLRLDAEVEDDRTLPDLRLWAPALGSRAADGDVLFGFDALPEQDGYARDDVRYRLALLPSRPDAPVAAPDVSGTRARVDSRLLEDAGGNAVAVATGEVGQDEVVWYSGAAPYRAPSGRPLSRGKLCQIGVPGVGTRTQAPCWTGDGRTVPLQGAVVQDADPLGRPLECRPERADDPQGFARCSRAAVAAVRVDLGTVQPLGSVVVRACPGVCLVETSRDGTAWSAPEVVDQTLGTSRFVGLGDDAQPVPVLVELPEATTGRYVRVRSDGPPDRVEDVGLPSLDARLLPATPPPTVAARTRDLTALTEVSVWAPRPRTAPEAAAVADVPGRSEATRLPLVPVLAAVVLLVTAAAGVARSRPHGRRGPSLNARSGPRVRRR